MDSGASFSELAKPFLTDKFVKILHPSSKRHNLNMKSENAIQSYPNKYIKLLISAAVYKSIHQ